MNCMRVHFSSCKIQVHPFDISHAINIPLHHLFYSFISNNYHFACFYGMFANLI